MHSYINTVWVSRDIVPSSSLMLGCGGVGILSVYGVVGLLGSAAGARSVETHAGSAMSKSSLLTELSSCMCVREKERGEEEEVRELRIFCAQNEAHPSHYRLGITRFSHISSTASRYRQSPHTCVKMTILNFLHFLFGSTMLLYVRPSRNISLYKLFLQSIIFSVYPLLRKLNKGWRGTEGGDS